MQVRFRGPLALYTGYAKGFAGLIRHLVRRDGIEIELTPINNSIPNGLDDDIRSLVTSSPRFDRMGILVGKPDKIGTLGTKYRIAYCMYETTDIPMTWVADLQHTDEVWVPSKFCADVISRHSNRVKIVSWGYNNDIFYRRKKTPKDHFEFGCAGVMSRRKGVDVLIDAFSKAFPEEKDVFLTIKTRDTRWLPSMSDDRIVVIDEDWTDEQMAEFYHRIDCLVQPSRGEGVGVPQLEAAACGTPVITTNWSGPADYIDNQGIWGLNITGLSRTQNGEMEARCSYWAEPDVNHLIELLRFMYNETPVVKATYGKYSFDAMADGFMSAITSAWHRSGR